MGAEFATAGVPGWVRAGSSASVMAGSTQVKTGKIPKPVLE
jgi:hypothetical protein